MLRLSGGSPSYLDGLGTNWQELPALTSSGRAIFGPGSGIVLRTHGWRRGELWQFLICWGGGGLHVGQANFRRRDDGFVSIAAILMRLLASTAAPSHNSKRSGPSARQRFMPRPRNRTEMRPSMPARKRWPSLKSAVFSYASRSAVFLPPRCGMHTTLTPACLHDARFCSLKKPRSVPYSSGTRPKACLWRRREGATWTSSEGFPFRTSYCVIRPCALSARNTL